MKNIHLIPTTLSDLLLCIKGYTAFEDTENEVSDTVGSVSIGCGQYTNTEFYQPQNMYITSEESISHNDFWLNTSKNTINKGHPFDLVNKITHCKKIILTTDEKLVQEGVQKIDDEFLEWYVKNSSCEEVEVERKTNEEIQIEIGTYGHDEGLLVSEFKEWLENGGVYYKIIIPKEEELSKNEIDRFFIDMVCNPKEPKQETLEEAAEIFAKNTRLKNPKSWFCEGAKWQAERGYSEEEVRKLTLDSLDLGMTIRQDQLRGYSEKSGKELHLEWFEKFKKKQYGL